jgi:DNA-binding beta-propeller fold protein YncE
MNTSPDFDRRISAWMDDQAPMREPDGLFERVTTELEQTSRLPAWRLPERWLPMTLTARLSLSPPLRSTWTLLLVGLITLALVVSLAIAGSQLLRDNDPTRLRGGMLVPTLKVDQTWDATAIDGLSQPSGLDVGPDGNLYVVNAGASEILVLDPDGQVVRRWGEEGNGPGQFRFQQDSQLATSTIGGVAVAADGSVFVADTANDRVQQFDAEGTYLRQIGAFGPGDGQFLNPFDLAIRDDGTLYVADFVRDDIQRFDIDGAYLETLATQGMDDGQLNDTGGIAIDADGALYNADFGNDRLQSWAPDGSFRWSIGRDEEDAVRFLQPGDVAVDSKGFTYVTEGERMTVLTPELALASTWDLPTSPKDEEWLPIAIADDGTVFLSSEYNGVIYKLRNSEAERQIPVASPVATAAPTPATAAAASASPVIADGLVVGAPFAVPFTADQPDGWIVNWTAPPGGVELAKMQVGSTEYVQATVRVFVPTNAYADPCHSSEGPMDPPVGPTVDDLTTALTNLPGVLVTSPVTDITIDGHPGKTFDLESTLLISDCPDDDAWDPMWTYDHAGQEDFSGPGQNFHQHIAILDVDGTRVLLEAWTFDDTSIANLADTLRVFDSIDFQ